MKINGLGGEHASEDGGEGGGETPREPTGAITILGPGDELASFLLRVAGQTDEDPVGSRAAIAATLLAALELAKSGAASLTHAFSPIWLCGAGDPSACNAAA